MAWSLSFSLCKMGIMEHVIHRRTLLIITKDNVAAVPGLRNNSALYYTTLCVFFFLIGTAYQ